MLISVLGNHIELVNGDFPFPHFKSFNKAFWKFWVYFQKYLCKYKPLKQASPMKSVSTADQRISFKNEI